MEIAQLLVIIKEPEKLLAPTEIEKAIEGCTFWIYRLEEDIFNQEQLYNTRLLDLHNKGNSIAASKVIAKTEEAYAELKRLDRIYKALKGLRSNLRRKYERLFKNY
jgi:hypothetical protein